jgi:hypothetical protein
LVDDCTCTLREKQGTSLSTLTSQLVLLLLHVSAEKHSLLQGATNVRHDMYIALYSQSLTNAKCLYVQVSSINTQYY